MTRSTPSEPIMTKHTDEELIAIAKAATPGPWNDSGHSVDDFDADCDMRMEWIPNGAADDDDELNANSKADAKFIATFNPAFVLSLIERARAAEALLSDSEEARNVLTAAVLERARERDEAVELIETQRSAYVEVQRERDEATHEVQVWIAHTEAAEARARTAEEALTRIAKLPETVCEPFQDGLAAKIAINALTDNKGSNQ